MKKWYALCVPLGLGLAAAPMGIFALPDDATVELAAANKTAQRIGDVQQVDAPPASPPATSAPVASEVQQILDLVNQERSARGLGLVSLDPQLNAAAQGHTADQAASGGIYHIAPDGTGSGERAEAAGYDYGWLGENVAAGQTTATSVMNAWMSSSGHCRNILNPEYTELGVGYLQTDTSYRYWWTQVFARPAGTPSLGGQYDPAWCS